MAQTTLQLDESSDLNGACLLCRMVAHVLCALVGTHRLLSTSGGWGSNGTSGPNAHLTARKRDYFLTMEDVKKKRKAVEE